MALIFAVFLVNPAPVCVLDEVDAPLDDANVERFCNLLDEMTRLTDTRFLVITHHALTMSRMHRLFGVTMAERGVSQLVSVTLGRGREGGGGVGAQRAATGNASFPASARTIVPGSQSACRPPLGHERGPGTQHVLAFGHLFEQQPEKPRESGAVAVVRENQIGRFRSGQFARGDDARIRVFIRQHHDLRLGELHDLAQAGVLEAAHRAVGFQMHIDEKDMRAGHLAHRWPHRARE